MESNGVPGRIHLSKETASALRKAGKEHWLVTREDKIVAKGKGELETYYCVITDDGTTCTTQSSISEEFTTEGRL